MRTYWTAQVTGNESRHSCSTNGDTLAASIERAITEAIYRQAINPTERISIDVEEYCVECFNHGTVLKRHKQVRCPECKGKIATGKVDTITFRMPDTSNRISLIAA